MVNFYCDKMNTILPNVYKRIPFNIQGRIETETYRKILCQKEILYYSKWCEFPIGMKDPLEYVVHFVSSISFICINN